MKFEKIIIPPGWKDTFTKYPNGRTIFEALSHTICKIRSIPFLDLYHRSNLRPWTVEGRAACYSKDDRNGVHPDETGHKIIAPRFKSLIESLLI